MSRSTRERKLLVTPLRAATSPSDSRLASRAWRSRAPKRILSVSSTDISYVVVSSSWSDASIAAASARTLSDRDSSQ